MTTTWVPISATTASHNDPHLTELGAFQPETAVTITENHVHLATVGPEGDCPEARLTAAEAREVAVGLLRAAELLEAGR